MGGVCGERGLVCSGRGEVMAWRSRKAGRWGNGIFSVFFLFPLGPWVGDVEVILVCICRVLEQDLTLFLQNISV